MALLHAATSSSTSSATSRTEEDPALGSRAGLFSPWLGANAARLRLWTWRAGVQAEWQRPGAGGAARLLAGRAHYRRYLLGCFQLRCNPLGSLPEASLAAGFSLGEGSRPTGILVWPLHWLPPPYLERQGVGREETAKGKSCRVQGNREMGKGWSCVCTCWEEGWKWLNFQSLFLCCRVERSSCPNFWRPFLQILANRGKGRFSLWSTGGSWGQGEGR